MHHSAELRRGPGLCSFRLLEPHTVSLEGPSVRKSICLEFSRRKPSLVRYMVTEVVHRRRSTDRSRNAIICDYDDGGGGGGGDDNNADGEVREEGKREETTPVLDRSDGRETPRGAASRRSVDKPRSRKRTRHRSVSQLLIDNLPSGIRAQSFHRPCTVASPRAIKTATEFTGR